MHKPTRDKTEIILAILTTLAASISHAADDTATAWLPQAQQAAKAWQADATLTRVGTTALKENGSALVWQYDFLSPASVTCARIIIIAGGDPRTQDLGSCSPVEPVSASFVDSPVMIREAIKAGFKPAETSDAYLAFMHDKAAPGRECWVVHTVQDFDPGNSVMRGWCVDPQSGQFVVRLSGETAAPKP
jgi:hypothetical protein